MTIRRRLTPPSTIKEYHQRDGLQTPNPPRKSQGVDEHVWIGTFAGRHGLSQRDNANPFALFDAMRDSFFRDGFPAANWGADSFKVDVKDANDHYELTADLPGMTKEDISLHYENGLSHDCRCPQ